MNAERNFYFLNDFELIIVLKIVRKIRVLKTVII